MIITVASGKGGTGKTTIAVNLALSIPNVQFLDCDVEEPNSHILLKPTPQKTEPVYTLIPKINEQLCNHCNECVKFCQFNVLFATPDKILVFPELCHSCKGCALVCPTKAITWEKSQIGILEFGKTNNFNHIYGKLQIGKPMAVPIIKELKTQIQNSKQKNVILDSPPGVSCPFIETIKGTDFCILVSEPTPFGLHDLKIAVDVLKQVNIPFGVIINRAGIGDQKIYQFLKNQNIPILMEIPYDKTIVKYYSQGKPFVNKMPQYKEKFQKLHEKIGNMIK